MDVVHKPVLLREAIEALDIQPGSWYIDATVGLGGHSLEILMRGGNVLGIDVDPEAYAVAKTTFEEAGFDEIRFVLVRGNFRDLKSLIPSHFVRQRRTSRGKQTETKFRGILFDLGVSSLQLDTPERGFSFSKEGPLDMRMDPGLKINALDLIKVLNKGEIYELFTKLGEEKFAKRLSEALVSAGQIETTKELADLVEGVYKTKGIRSKRNPSTKVFQALRIVVNDELNALTEGLQQAVEKVEKNGHIVVISFHSLEDRIVKSSFREWEERGFGQVLTKKPVIPGEQEIVENPRSRSAKLRAFEKYDNHQEI